MSAPLSPDLARLVEILARLDADDYLTAAANDGAGATPARTNHVPLPLSDKAA
jgi:hypothetical protein